ncbi:hypothetical protein V3F56_01925 [Moorellaceae bacterium AZ2]
MNTVRSLIPQQQVAVTRPYMYLHTFTPRRFFAWLHVMVMQ